MKSDSINETLVDLVVVSALIWGILISFYPLIPLVTGIGLTIYGAVNKRLRPVYYGSGIALASLFFLVS